jgi:hypothetical protein
MPPYSPPTYPHFSIPIDIRSLPPRPPLCTLPPPTLLALRLPTSLPPLPSPSVHSLPPPPGLFLPDIHTLSASPPSPPFHPRPFHSCSLASPSFTSLYLYIPLSHLHFSTSINIRYLPFQWLLSQVHLQLGILSITLTLPLPLARSPAPCHLCQLLLTCSPSLSLVCLHDLCDLPLALSHPLSPSPINIRMLLVP